MFSFSVPGLKEKIPDWAVVPRLHMHACFTCFFRWLRACIDKGIFLCVLCVLARVCVCVCVYVCVCV